MVVVASGCDDAVAYVAYATTMTDDEVVVVVVAAVVTGALRV